MKIRILPALLVLSLAPLVSAQGENPFRTAKVGDYVNYKISTKVGEFAVPGEMKMTVTEKDEKNATMEMEFSIMGVKQKQSTKIDLTQAYDTKNLAGIGGGAAQGFKIEKGEDGKQTIEIGGKKYECNWTSFKMTGNAGGMQITANNKIWLSKSVPLAGMVKMETNMKSGIGDVVVTVEFSGSGSK